MHVEVGIDPVEDEEVLKGIELASGRLAPSSRYCDCCCRVLNGNAAHGGHDPVEAGSVSSNVVNDHVKICIATHWKGLCCRKRRAIACRIASYGLLRHNLPSAAS